MSILYPRSYLHRISADDLEVPLRRYVYKFEKQRKEIVHLKFHEKDFLFRALLVLRDAEGNSAYDLFNILEAREFLFHWIILTHSNQVMVFDGPIRGPFGLLSPSEKRKNKRFFYEYLAVWKNQIEKGDGPYMSIIKVEVGRKIKSWQEWAGTDKARKKQLQKKIEYVYSTFFHIYYHVKLYFDEKMVPYVIRQIAGYDVVFNIYSYVHIFSRHYCPNMNHDIGKSLNVELDCVDLDSLPDSIFSLIEKRNSLYPLTYDTEFLVYSYGQDYYMLWLKYKRLNETRRIGFEVRSFYKCESEIDMNRIRSVGAKMVVPI